jgi:hypothetical protein
MKLLFDDRALQTDLVRTDRIVPIASFAGLEILTLRHQLNILRRKSPKRPTFGSIDRLVFTGLYGLAPSVLSALAIVRPKPLFIGTAQVSVCIGDGDRDRMAAGRGRRKTSAS